MKMIFPFPGWDMLISWRVLKKKLKETCKKKRGRIDCRPLGPLNYSTQNPYLLWFVPEIPSLGIFQMWPRNCPITKGYITWRFRISYKIFLCEIALLVETSAIDTSQSGCHRPVALVKRLRPEVFHNMHGLPSGKLT